MVRHWICLLAVLLFLFAAAPARANEDLAEGLRRFLPPPTDATDPLLTRGRSIREQGRRINELRRISQEATQARRQMQASLDAVRMSVGALRQAHSDESTRSNAESAMSSSMASLSDATSMARARLQGVNAQLASLGLSPAAAAVPTPEDMSALRGPTPSAVEKEAAGLDDAVLDDALRVSAELDAAATTARQGADAEFAQFTNRALSLEQSDAAKSRSLFAVGVDKFRSIGLTLTKNTTPTGLKEPATFTYTRRFRPDPSKDEEEHGFAAQAALTWTVPTENRPFDFLPGGRNLLRPQISIETDLDTTRADEKNLVALYAGIEYIFLATDPKFDKWYKYVGRSTAVWPVQAQVKYLTTLNGDYEEVSAHFESAPALGSLAMGVRRGHETACSDGHCLIPRNLISFFWQPRAAIDLGSVIDSDPDVDPDVGNEFFARGEFEMSGRVYLDFLARGIFYQSFQAERTKGEFGTIFDEVLIPYLHAGYTVWYEPTRSDEWHDRLRATFNFPFSKLISVEVTYEDGRAPPSYRREKTLTVSLGIKI